MKARKSALDPAIPPPILPDVLMPGLKLVFCGTAAGTVSARRGQYYAHPQNRF
jgi:TDG/mug DNA glycosylase family protein